MIDAYLCGFAEPTLKNCKSRWKKFIYFLQEENYNNSDWEDINVCQKIYLEFLNWVFVRKEVILTFLNMVYSLILKFLTIFIPNFNFPQTNFVKNIKKKLTKNIKIFKYMKSRSSIGLLSRHKYRKIKWKRQISIFTDKNSSIIRILPPLKHGLVN
jgi:hypothetical protein